MQHIRGLTSVQLQQPSVVTVGMFDGVHRGHQELMQRLVAAARASGYLAVVLTFYPHPDVVIHGITGRYYLTTPERRAYLLGELGIDVVVTHPFDEQVRQLRAADFVNLMQTHLQLAALWASPEFALGYKREGNIDFLRQQGQQKGFDVQTIELLTNSGQVINSGSIRDALENGELARANDLLGRSYAVGGEIVHGQQRGRQLGFPTANIAVWEAQLLPPRGVYACRAHLGDESFMAVTNVGQRPTFNGDSVTVEAHLLDFDRDIYGEHMMVEFVQHMRGEMKFASVDALVAQVNRDIEAGRRILESREF